MGRLTLEPWLVPRSPPELVTSHPGCSVVRVAAGADDGATDLTLSDGQALHVDFAGSASGGPPPEPDAVRASPR